MIRLLSVCGSPVENSSTELLLRRIAASIQSNLRERVRHRLVALNELDINPCQACGEDPAPQYCFVNDSMTLLYKDLEACDCLLFGTPIYFDTVSAQAKLFIDRCNCLRPAVFGLEVPRQTFVRRWKRIRPAAMVIVGGDQAWFEGARRTLAGFFKWIGFSNEGFLSFGSVDYNRSGEAAESPELLAEADRIGEKLAEILGNNHDRR